MLIKIAQNIHGDGVALLRPWFVPRVRHPAASPFFRTTVTGKSHYDFPGRS